MNEALPSAAEPEREIKLPLAGFKGTPEEQDLQWFEQCYRGDTQRQLTVRAVIMGGIIGMFTGVANLYTTLKIGWSFGVSITACVISFVAWNTICSLFGGRISRMSVLENNCMQSTATAAGSSTGSTLATALGSLLLITGVHQPWPVAASFVLFTAALGVFLAIPMKRQMINHEQLRFPSGVATAETLRSLYSKSGEALKQAYSLLIALLGGALVGLLHNYADLVEQLKLKNRLPVWLEKLSSWLYLPALLDFPRFLNPLARGQMAGLGFEPSVPLVGAGMITGLRVGLSMFAASTLLYYVIVPWLLAHDAANAAVAGFVPSFHRAENGDFNPVRWALWGGTSVMVFSSLMQMALNWRTVMRAFMIFKKAERAAIHDAVDAVEVPNSWLFLGLIPISIGLIAVQFFAFHIAVWLGLISVAFSFVVSLVACRATGETDQTPIGAMGKVTQLLYAVLPGAKGIESINLMAAGTTAAAAGAAADLLTDLKSGYLLGANPRRQFLAQFFGVFFGVIAVVPAWYLMVPTKKVLESMNPPATNMWRAVADLLTQGVNLLPRTALYAIVIGALVGAMLPVLEKLWPRLKPYLPSAMGLGLAWVVPFQNSFSFFIGGVIVSLWQKWNRKNSDTFAIPIASGLIAGESLVAAFIAIACTLVGLLASR
ncbi:MAG TPA: OPT family oligopeptide transporter [Verrucomicrobiae bacterium]|jgi:putative OPT family oligopeptide transporter|nr:OPT family oligopeptide transporter [Verrucomicrobiae bacterium]